MNERARIVAAGIAALPVDPSAALVDWALTGCMVGLTGAMMWAHLPGPRFIRERDMFADGDRVEHVQAPGTYLLSGGDCDDSVAMMTRAFAPLVGLNAGASFVPARAPRHVRSWVEAGGKFALVDRIGKATRFRMVSP